MIFLLLILASSPALLVLLRAKRLTHVVLFSLGYLYYWILPILVGESPFNASDSDLAFRSWTAIFTDLSKARLVLYATSVLVYYGCFCLGDFLAKQSPTRERVHLVPRLSFLTPLYWVMFTVAVTYTYHIRWAIGMDYADTGDVLIAKGTLTAISLVLLGIGLLKTVSDEKQQFLPSIRNLWLFGYFLISVALLAMGQRLHFVTFLLLLLSYRSVFFQPFTKLQLAGGGLVLAALGSIAGLLRLGKGVGLGPLFVNLVSEPVFTSFSLVSFLRYSHVPWVELPRFLAGDFLNLVPTAILPNKPNLLPDPIAAGFWFTSPLGALNSWVSFMINFGLFGTALVMLMLGYFLRWLLRNAHSPIIKTQYLMISAFLVFTFFRDPFSVSVVKNIFEFSIVAPCLCAYLSGWMVWTAETSKQIPVDA